MIGLALLLFCAGVVQDAIWALYIIHTGQQHKLRSAFYSVGTGLGSMIMVTGMMAGQMWLMLFWLLGLWVGTYFARYIEVMLTRCWQGLKKVGEGESARTSACNNVLTPQRAQEMLEHASTGSNAKLMGMGLNRICYICTRDHMSYDFDTHRFFTEEGQ